MPTFWSDGDSKQGLVNAIGPYLPIFCGKSRGRVGSIEQISENPYRFEVACRNSRSDGRWGLWISHNVPFPPCSSSSGSTSDRSVVCRRLDRLRRAVHADQGVVPVVCCYGSSCLCHSISLGRGSDDRSTFLMCLRQEQRRGSPANSISIDRKLTHRAMKYRSFLNTSFMQLIPGPGVQGRFPPKVQIN